MQFAFWFDNPFRYSFCCTWAYYNLYFQNVNHSYQKKATAFAMA